MFSSTQTKFAPTGAPEMFRGHNRKLSGKFKTTIETDSTLRKLTFKVLLEEDLRIGRNEQGEYCDQAQGDNCKLSHCGLCDLEIDGRGKYRDPVF